MSTYNLFLFKSIQCALKAGKKILEVYDSDYAVEHKADNSPLTQADQASHDVLVGALERFKLPVLSEEGREIPYEERKTWERVWIIDPLDGTKEFIKHNGEFTVNIALVEYGRATLGVVYAPVKDILYFAAVGTGAYRIDHASEAVHFNGDLGERKTDDRVNRILKGAVRLPVTKLAGSPYTIVGSRSHSGPELKNFVEQKRREYGEVNFVSAGSSLKICLVAEGTADLYPRFGPTCEWDTAAGQAIAENAGAKLLDFKTGEPLRYNRSDMLNPWFVVRR
jgi:3'(2'), 5'-bisphosphate nucleotidase